MAEQLVASMTGEFSADDYQDDYRQALMAVIERKVAGEKPEPAAARAEPTNITDLMAALEASVSAARQDRKAGTADAAPARVPAKAARAGTKAKAKAKKAAEAEAEAPRQRRRKTA
jgi:DNA end-binding protein Ku